MMIYINYLTCIGQKIQKLFLECFKKSYGAAYFAF